MLQQTQARTVIPYFERFIARFPDIETLARAALDDVLHLWSGLGYYARARNLHRAAGIVVQDHGGVVPDTAAAVQALPGIGRSTAAAIVAQGYGKRAAILDGNVKRVLARRHRIAGPVTSAATLNALWGVAESHTPTVRVADYTQAIMDLGATLCRRTRPLCSNCPVSADCLAFAAGDPERYPAKAPRPRRRLERRRFFVLVDPGGACWVEKRAPSGLWGGLWSPPERDAEEPVDGFLREARIDTDLVGHVRRVDTFRHGFTHYDLDVEPIYVYLTARPAATHAGVGRWINPGSHELGLSTVAARLVVAASVATR